MSIFSTIFSPLDKWRENPERMENPPPSHSEEITNIDKEERIKVDGIEEISINARTNIIIATSTDSEIVLRIHGITTANYELNACVTQIERSIHINARGNSSSKKELSTKEEVEEGVANHTFANITLEVLIPEKSQIKKIKIKNSNGDIICKASINVETLDVINKNGNVQIGSTFKNINVSSKLGNVNIRTTAASDLYVEVDNLEGTVNLNIDNIRDVYLQYQLDGGGLINPKYSGDFKIYGKVKVSKGSFIYS